MTKIILRPIKLADGALMLGEPLGSAELGSVAILYDGSTLVGKIVGSIARRWSLSEREAFEAIVAEGWSNGRLLLAAETDEGTDDAGRSE